MLIWLIYTPFVFSGLFVTAIAANELKLALREINRYRQLNPLPPSLGHRIVLDGYQPTADIWQLRHEKSS